MDVLQLLEPEPKPEKKKPLSAVYFDLVDNMIIWTEFVSMLAFMLIGLCILIAEYCDAAYDQSKFFILVLCCLALNRDAHSIRIEIELEKLKKN